MAMSQGVGSIVNKTQTREKMGEVQLLLKHLVTSIQAFLSQVRIYNRITGY